MCKKKVFGVLMITLFFLFSSLKAQGVGFYGFGGYGLGRGGDHWCSSETFNSSWDVTSVQDHYLNILKGFLFVGGLQIDFSNHVSMRLVGEYSKMTE